MSAILSAGQVVYGMQLPVQAQSSLFAEPWERYAGAAELAEVARAADEAGFFYVGVCDHVAIPRRLAEALGTTWYDTMTTLGFLAGITRRTRLLSHVLVVAHRHPLVTAKAIATLDKLSEGRAILGVGAGHVPEEFGLFGTSFERRGSLLDESIRAISAALQDEFPLLGDGELGLDGSWGVSPRPIQKPRPPVWVGGSSPAAVRRAARLGDGWLPQGTARRDLPALIALLRRERDASGRQAAEMAIDVGTITEWIYVGKPSWDLGRRCISGSSEEIAGSLREYVDMGVGHLQVRFPSRSVDELVDQVRAFGAEVGPLLTADPAEYPAADPAAGSPTGSPTGSGPAANHTTSLAQEA